MPNPRHIFSTHSDHYHVRVVDEDGKRVLYFGDQSETEIDPTNPGRGGLEYTTAVHCARLFHPSLQRVLVLGLGGGSLITGFLDDYPEVTVDVVELDPVVVDVARNHFGLPETPRLRVIVGEGRSFLRRTRRRYDLVVMDAYGIDQQGELALPPQLATVQFFNLVRSRLTDDGLLAFNITATLFGRDSDLTRNVLRTLRETFPHLCAFEMSSIDNVLAFARSSMEFPSKRSLRKLVRQALDEGVVSRPGMSQLCKRYFRERLPRSGTICDDSCPCRTP